MPFPEFPDSGALATDFYRGQPKLVYSAKMYWGRTDWSYPPGLTVTRESGGLRVRGTYGPAGCSFWTQNTKKGTLSTVWQYFLGTDRMPEDGEAFVSSPVAHMSGNLYGETQCGLWFEGPSAICEVVRKQEVFAGNARSGWSSASCFPIIMRGQTWASQREEMPPRRKLGWMRFRLDRSKPLKIKLTLEFKMTVTGSGKIEYLTSPDSGPFLIRIPQWYIYCDD